MIVGQVDSVSDFFCYEMTSMITDYTYSINVYVPQGQAPKEGFPIIYVLDGSSYFQYVKEAIRLQSRNAPKTGVLPAIVVGIGHLADMHERRFYDFTAPAKTYSYPARFKGKGYHQHGGAENFSRFLQEELKPRLSAQFHVNEQQQTLFGHSLAGYFALWQLLNNRGSYQHYIAISPSIWWNEHELFARVKAFMEAHQHVKETIFIGVGELETFMVEDARQIADQLEKVMDIVFYEALSENHASVVPTVMSRAIRFVHKN